MIAPLAIFLCDRTGIMAIPWASAGFDCYCVDLQHSIRRERVEDGIRYVWGDARSWTPPEGRIAFVAAFPPCTHLAVSGARDFKRKGGWMLADALQTFDACMMAGAYSGAPYMVENPIGRLNTHRRKPDHLFDPCDYAGYLDDPASESYTKRTGIWCGNGFIMPPPKAVIPTLGSIMHRMPPSDNRADLRAVTPRGFALAVFIANVDRVRNRLEAA